MGDLAEHDHVSWTYERLHEDWRAALARFFADGAEAGHRLLYTSPVDEHALWADLADLPAREELLASGQLVLLTHTVPPQERRAAVRLVGELRTAVESALSGSCTTVRLATRVRADDLLTADGQDLSPSFAAFELFADRLVATAPVIALCGLDARTSQPATEAVQVVHPLRRSPAPGAAVASLFALGEDTWALAGEVDLGIRRAVDGAVAALADDRSRSAPNGSPDHHLDLRHLTFADVAGLRALVDIAGALHPGLLVLHHCPGWLELMLQKGWGDVPGLVIAD